MIFGNRSMDTVRRPLCGCFVLSCMVGDIFRKPLGFRRCLPPARPEKAKPFQAGRSPCTKHQQTVRLCLYAPKKVFEGSKGRFFKNAPWQGVGQRPAKRGKASQRGTPFQAGQGPFTKHRQTVRLRLHEPKKVFEGSKGRFLKTPPWQGVGQRPTKRIKQKTRPDRLKSQASLSSGFTGKDHSSFSSTTFLAQMISKFPLRQRRSLRKARSSF